MEIVYAAAVTGAFGLISILLNRSVKKQAKGVSDLNTVEHLMNKAVLERIETKVDHVGSSVTEHLGWHLHQPTVTNVNVHPPQEAA